MQSTCETSAEAGLIYFVVQIHVVKEDRHYLSWPNKASKLKGNAFLKESSGILSAKRAINELHRWLGEQGYTQVGYMLGHVMEYVTVD